MFRLIFEPKTPKGDMNCIPVFSRVFDDINDFRIDIESHEIVVNLNTNPKRGLCSNFQWTKESLKYTWDNYGLQYEFEPCPSSIVRVKIPEGYNVQAILHYKRKRNH